MDLYVMGLCAKGHESLGHVVNLKVHAYKFLLCEHFWTNKSKISLFCNEIHDVLGFFCFVSICSKPPPSNSILGVAELSENMLHCLLANGEVLQEASL